MKSSLISKFYPVIFITVVVIIMASLLALTDSFTWTKLKAQQDQQTLEMLKEIFPEVSYYVLEDDIYTIYNYRKSVIGYAFYAKGLGYAGEINILVGLEDKETIKGITIISHYETLGGGSEGELIGPLDLSPLVAQFIGLKIIDCELKKYDGRVDAITGATESSEAVVDIVRKAALRKVESIK